MAIPVSRTPGAKASGTTSAVSVPLPADIVVGDIAILVAETDPTGTVTITVTGGGTWTAFAGTPVTVASGSRLYAWWRRHASGNTAPSVQANVDHVCAGCTAYGGCVSSGVPVHVSATGTEAASDTSFEFITGLTTTATDCICLCICTSSADSNTGQFTAMTNALLSSMAEKMDYETTSGHGGGFGFDQGGLATPGAMGTFAATLSAAWPKAYIAFALMPPQLETKSAVDSGVGSESRPSTSPTVVRVISDAATGGDLSAKPAATQSKTDSAAASEVETLTAADSSFDSAAATETPLLMQGKAGQDAGAGVEAGQLQASRAGADAGTSADAGALAAGRTAADTGATFEVTSIAGALSAADTATVGETPALTTSQAKSDAGAATETPSLYALAAVGDTGFGLESPALSAGQTRQDSGSALESAAVAVALGCADGGLAGEVSDLLTPGMETKSSSDSGAASELTMLLANLMAADTSAGAEASDLYTGPPAKFGADQATASESALLLALVAASDSGDFGERGYPSDESALSLPRFRHRRGSRGSRRD